MSSHKSHWSDDDSRDYSRDYRVAHWICEADRLRLTDLEWSLVYATLVWSLSIAYNQFQRSCRSLPASISLSRLAANLSELMPEEFVSSFLVGESSDAAPESPAAFVEAAALAGVSVEEALEKLDLSAGVAQHDARLDRRIENEDAGRVNEADADAVLTFIDLPADVIRGGSGATVKDKWDSFFTAAVSSSRLLQTTVDELSESLCVSTEDDQEKLMMQQIRDYRGALHLSPSDPVRAHGLRHRPELNGELGIVLGELEALSARVLVHFGNLM